MKKDNKFGINELRFLYFRYKDSPYFLLGIISLIVISSFILFLQLVVPQIQSWFSIRNEILRTSNRIEIINRNIAHMKAQNQTVLDNQVEMATNALPIEKDFGTVISALSDSALNAGVSMEDFSFQVGKVASVEGQLNSFGQKELSIVKVIVVLTGSINNIRIFLSQVQNKLPLSEVTEVHGDIISTIATIQFYQKKFPEIVFKDDVPIRSFSSKQLSLLDKLSLWVPLAPQVDPLASPSAGGAPLF